MNATTLTRAQKDTTFASTMKCFGKNLMSSIKDLQAAEEKMMQGSWMAKEGKAHAGWSLDNVIQYAQYIIDEAKTMQDSIKG